VVEIVGVHGALAHELIIGCCRRRRAIGGAFFFSTLRVVRAGAGAVPTGRQSSSTSAPDQEIA